VIRNLLSNAIKFSPEGSLITIFSEDLGREVLYSVSDTGVGIPGDELEAIFDKFIQSSKTKTGSGGTGLGLPISTQIINDHNGRLWAENNPDGGAVFKFIIPKKYRKKKKIGQLLVEQGHITRNQLAEMLKRQET
jgi:signal transduction histidine kinase